MTPDEELIRRVRRWYFDEVMRPGVPIPPSGLTAEERERALTLLAREIANLEEERSQLLYCLPRSKDTLLINAQHLSHAQGRVQYLKAESA